MNPRVCGNNGNHSVLVRCFKEPGIVCYEDAEAGAWNCVKAEAS